MHGGHTEGDVNVRNDEWGQPGEVKPLRDWGVRCGAKQKRRSRDEGSRVVTRTAYFFGCRARTSTNAGSDMTTSVEVAAGMSMTGISLATWWHEMIGGLGVEATICAIDRGSDDSENHCLSESRSLRSPSHGMPTEWRRETRTGRCGSACWRHRNITPAKGSGAARVCRGLGRCCHIGRFPCMIQVHLAGGLLILKRMVKQLREASRRRQTRVGGRTQRAAFLVNVQERAG